ncbi:hypothetical protein PQQ75_25090 [Paraburkholderia aspalathi]|uniref:hypothetical protein n=1 Tax=Paraburkholderia aspalathi TaxID=1324617 RepID=UPI0038BC1A3B
MTAPTDKLNGLMTTDEQIIERCKVVGIKWIPPELTDDCDYEMGFPGSFDMVSMSEMRALLSASKPAVAQREREAFEADLRAKGATDYGLERWIRHPEHYSDREVQAAWQAWQARAMLALSPAAPAQSDRPVAEMIVRRKDVKLIAWSKAADMPEGKYKLYAAPLPAQPAQSEPAAWRHSLTHCLYETEAEVPLADGDEWAVPLYLSAQPAQTMESEAEHSAIYISKRLTGSDKDASFVQAHINQAVSEAMELAAQPAQTERPPSFDAKHVRLRGIGAKMLLTLELDAVEPAPRYTVTPVNPSVVRAAAQPASGGSE